MSAVFRVSADGQEELAVAAAAAARAVSNGRLVVFPTETVYGIASRPDDPDATARLFAAKERPRRLALPILAASSDEALALAAPSAEVEATVAALAATFWPGPLTLVLPRSELSERWQLGDADASVALRVPDHPVALAVLVRTGPLAVTSANRSGRSPAGTWEELRATFGDRVAVFVVMDGPIGAGARSASTVLDLGGDHPRVLRLGPIGHRDLAEVLRGMLPATESID